MVLVCFIIGALVVGLILYLPFFVWFRLRSPPAGNLVSPDLQLSLHLAFVEGRRLRYEMLSTEHLLLALLGNPCVVDALRACSVDIAGMRGGVSAIVRDGTPVAAGTGPVETGASPEFTRVIQRAIVRVQAVAGSTGQGRNASKTPSWIPAILRKSAARRTVDGADVLVALLEEPECRATEALRRHGVTRLAVAKVIAHGITNADPAAQPELRASGVDDVAVVLENDDFTPMEFVVGMLQEHLGHKLASAVRVMLEIHNQGRAVGGQFPADVARDKAERVRAAASQAGHPLRCVVEAR
jgi:ATP-dependent Clp protease adapter protein ClpS